MILRILKSNNQRNLILFPVIGILFWAKSLLFPFSYDFYPGENANLLFLPLYNIIHNWPFFQVFLSYILVITLAFFIQFLNDRYSFIRIRTKLPATIFVAVIAGFTELHTLHPVFLSALFLMFGIYNLFGTFEQKKPYSKIFNAGFFVGIGSIFY